MLHLYLAFIKPLYNTPLPQQIFTGSSVPSCLTQNQIVSWHFPGQVIGQVDGVHVDVLVAVLAHRLDHLPSDLIARLLTTYSKCARHTQKHQWPVFPSEGAFVLSAEGILTFFHTAMRMMMDMMMMGTNVKTTANSTTWENRAAPANSRKTTSILASISTFPS